MLDEITVLIPSSPIAAHPGTAVIEECVASVRAQLPDSEIIIMLDGVRPEQEHYRENYEKYKQKLLWLCNNQWRNVLPVVHEEHKHQAIMTREALDMVHTPLLLFVEHDAPPTPDRIIEWPDLVEAIKYGQADMIRLHHEEIILAEHEAMMLDIGPDGSGMRATVQWSQRPHLASVAFYRRILAEHFRPDQKTMVEDVMHGVVQEAYRRDGEMGWHNYRLWVYLPTTDDLGIKRSYHLDARGSDSKFEETFGVQP